MINNIETISKRLSKMEFFFEHENYNFSVYWLRFVKGRHNTLNVYFSHTHSFIEIQLCLEGSCVIMVNNKDYYLKKGDFIFINKNHIHQLKEESTNLVKVVLGFNVTGLDSTSKELIEQISPKPLTNILYSNNMNLINIATNISTEINELKYEYKKIIESYIYLFFIDIVRTLIKKDYVEESPEQFVDYRIKTINKFIKDNIKSKLKTTTIVEEFGLCEKQLNRLSLKYNGVSIKKYILNLKIEEAKRLIKESNYSIKEISQILSFTDEYIFSKIFKRETNLSPSSFKITNK